MDWLAPNVCRLADDANSRSGLRGKPADAAGKLVQLTGLLAGVIRKLANIGDRQSDMVRRPANFTGK